MHAEGRSNWSYSDWDRFNLARAAAKEDRRIGQQKAALEADELRRSNALEAERRRNMGRGTPKAPSAAVRRLDSDEPVKNMSLQNLREELRDSRAVGDGGSLPSLERSKTSQSREPKPVPTENPDLSEDLEQLSQLFERGLLTEDEFTAAKKRLLGTMPPGGEEALAGATAEAPPLISPLRHQSSTTRVGSQRPTSEAPHYLGHHHRPYQPPDQSLLQRIRQGNLGPVPDLKGANLYGADLSGADLREANLEGADLREANLEGANLNAADFNAADLRGAKLTQADLSGANLRGAKLTRADLSRANLSGANLSGANLRRAKLTRADLTGTSLAGAILKGAKFGYVSLTDADLQGATANRMTSWPAGFDPVAAGVFFED